MALKFYNIRSKEILVADTEPKIAALYNSSDRSPNVSQGQDFGWRIAPEVVVELRRIKRNAEILKQIASNINKALNEVSEIDVLKYISDMTDLEVAPDVDPEDYEDEYRAEIKRLEKGLPKVPRVQAPVAAPEEKLVATDDDSAILNELAEEGDSYPEAPVLEKKAQSKK